MHRVITVFKYRACAESGYPLATGDSDHISHQFDAWLMENALPSGFEWGLMGWRLGWRDERECARWPLTLTLSPEGRGDRLCSILNMRSFSPSPHWGEGRCLLHTQLIAHTHLPFSALHPPVADAPIKLALAIVQLPAAIFKLAAGSSYCLRRSSLTSRCQPSSRNLHSLAHGQGYKRH